MGWICRAELQNIYDALGRELTAIVLAEHGQIGCALLQRPGYRAISLAAHTMAWSAITHVGQISMSGDGDSPGLQ